VRAFSLGAVSSVPQRRPVPTLRLVAVALVVAAAVVLVIRLPGAFRSFDQRATANNGQSEIGRQIAGADAEDIDNEFLVQALQLLPQDATYAILLPQTPQIAATYHISEPTYNALPGFVLNALLPRRQVDANAARYILCYACNTDPYDPRMKRLWQNDQGLVIGELTR
jgi:hypothetical protein